MPAAWRAVRTLVIVVTRYPAVTTIPRTGRIQSNPCTGEAYTMRRRRLRAVEAWGGRTGVAVVGGAGTYRPGKG
jgi:hypothetical protein